MFGQLGRKDATENRKAYLLLSDIAFLVKKKTSSEIFKRNPEKYSKKYLAKLLKKLQEKFRKAFEINLTRDICRNAEMNPERFSREMHGRIS